MQNLPPWGKAATIAAWSGNLLLTALGGYLVFTQTEPLSPLTFFTIALCLLGGNALPVGLYVIHLLWQKDLLKAEATEATMTQRQMMARLVEAEERLRVASDEASKAILVARQLPTRLEEADQKISEALTNLQPEQFQEAARTVREAVTEVRQFKGEVAALSQEEAAKTIERLQTQLSEYGALEKRIDIVPTLVADHLNLPEWSKQLRERDETLQADFDGLVERLASLEQQVKEMADAVRAQESPAATTIIETPPVEEVTTPETTTAEPEIAEDPDWSVDDFSLDDGEVEEIVEDETGQEEVSAEDAESVKVFEEEAVASDTPVSDLISEEVVEPKDAGRAPSPDKPSDALDEEEIAAEDEATVEEAAPEVVDEVQGEPATEANASDKNLTEIIDEAPPADAPAMPIEEPEATLFPDLETKASNIIPIADGHVRVRVKAMVGIANKVFLRITGAEPDWEAGLALNLTGIGEYEWKTSDLTAPITVQAFMNNEVPAQGDPIVVEPGNAITIQAKF